jgi:ubiquinol-cytochrome c reductase cytochrome c1 subunit
MRGIFLGVALTVFAVAGMARAEDTLSPLKFQSDGVFGSYDKAALQRGFLVYQSNCAACHSMNALHYRDLLQLGLTPDQVAGIAAGVKMADGSAGTLDDVFKAPNLPAAAFGGAVPPDLSGIVAGRPGGVRYVFAYLTGYTAAPADLTLLPGHYFNAAYPGNQTAMPAPLKGNDVAYADGTPTTAAQEAQDVSAFLGWAADPNLDVRHAIGLRAMIFLIVLTVLAVATKRRVWREAV